MDLVAFAGRVLLVLVFGIAAVGKLVDHQAARRALTDFRVPVGLVGPVSWLLPLTEFSIAVTLLIQPAARYAALGAALLLVLFMCGIAAAILRGEAPDCNCFGQIGSKPAGKRTLARNALFGAVAVFVASYGPGIDPGTWFAPDTNAKVAVLVLALVGITTAAALAGLINERRSLRSDLTAAEAALALFPPGLPVGTDAPAFSRPRPDGTEVALADLVRLGRPVALVFVSPTCRPCHHMFPDISRWQQTLSDRLTITLLVHGTTTEAAEIGSKFGLTNLLSDPKATVFREYRGQGTPSLVIVNPDGRIGIRIRSSHGAVEAAIRRALQEAPAAAPDDKAIDAALPLIDVKRWSGRDAQRA